MAPVTDTEQEQRGADTDGVPLGYAPTPTDSPRSPLALAALVMAIIANVFVAIMAVPVLRMLVIAAIGRLAFARYVVLLSLLLGLVAFPMGVVAWSRRPGGRRELLAVFLVALY